MQAWDSFLVKAETRSKYAGSAGCVVSIDRENKSITGRMDVDGQTVSFLEADCTRLG